MHYGMLQLFVFIMCALRHTDTAILVCFALWHTASDFDPQYAIRHAASVIVSLVCVQYDVLSALLILEMYALQHTSSVFDIV